MRGGPSRRWTVLCRKVAATVGGLRYERGRSAKSERQWCCETRATRRFCPFIGWNGGGRTALKKGTFLFFPVMCFAASMAISPPDSDHAECGRDRGNGRDSGSHRRHRNSLDSNACPIWAERTADTFPRSRKARGRRGGALAGPDGNSAPFLEYRPAGGLDNAAAALGGG